MDGRGAGRRALDLLPFLALPYVVLVLSLLVGAVEVTGRGLRLAPSAGSAQGVLLAGLALLAAALAAATTSASASRAVVGCAAYSIVLFLSIGLGGVRALLNAIGGEGGEAAGARQTTVVLGLGALLALAALLGQGPLLMRGLAAARDPGEGRS